MTPLSCLRRSGWPHWMDWLFKPTSCWLAHLNQALGCQLFLLGPWWFGHRHTTWSLARWFCETTAIELARESNLGYVTSFSHLETVKSRWRIHFFWCLSMDSWSHSPVVRYWYFLDGGRPHLWPRSSVFDELGIRLKNQLFYKVYLSVQSCQLKNLPFHLVKHTGARSARYSLHFTVDQLSVDLYSGIIVLSF